MKRGACLIEAEADVDRLFQATSTTSNVLNDVEMFIKRFVVLPDAAYLPLSTWTAATYLCDIFDCFPYLALISPVKRCGKTRLLEVIELQAHKAWRGAAPSPAALYRMTESAPTLLLDEVEALNSKSTSELQQAILAILNAGHRKGATIPRCDGPAHVLRHFPVYGPKAFAAIGNLPDTLLDRSIVVSMQRRLPAQKVERLLWAKAKKEVEPITEALFQFAANNGQVIREEYERLMVEDLPSLSDRDADLWLPLYAVCSVAAPDRIAELQQASEQLCSAKGIDDESESLALRLLSDLDTVWGEDEQRVPTKALLERLKQADESPWGDEDLKLSSRRLARMLKPFGVRPTKWDHGHVRGYERDPINRAVSRYLSRLSAPSAT